MSTGIFTDAFAVYADNEAGNEFVATTAGPAGTAELRLPDGTVIAVDYVEPQQLVSVHLDPLASPSLAASLVGATRADVVASQPEQSDGRPFWMPRHDAWTGSAPVTIDYDDDGPNSLAPDEFGGSLNSGRHRPTFEAQLLGRMALLQTLSFDHALSDLAQATAALELASHLDAGDLGGIEGISALLEPTLDRAAMLLAGTSADLRGLVDEKDFLARQLLPLCRRFASRREPIANALLVLDFALDRPTDDWHEFGGQQRATGTHDIRYAALSPLDDNPVLASYGSAVPAPMRQRSLRPVADHTVELRPGGRVFVASLRPADAKWIRVLNKHTLTLLALAPMIEDEDGDWCAEAVVPTVLRRDDLIVEITATPVPAGTPSSLVVAREAVRAGREAVRAGAAGRLLEMQQRWRATAALWRQLGDDARSELAERHATDRGKMRRQHALAEQVD